MKETKPQISYQNQSGTLYKGNCLDVLKLIPDESLDCVFADPPFNLKKDYQNGNDDDMDEAEYLEWCLAWIDECIKKLKPGGALFIYHIPLWAIPIAGHLWGKLTFRHWIAIESNNRLPIRNKLYPSHYALLYFIKGKKPKTFNLPRTPIKTCRKCKASICDYGGHLSKLNPEGISLKDVWTDTPPLRHKKNKTRAANQLNPKILERVLMMSTEKGDLVFDPFGGSGTTFVVAQKMGRNWIGSELGDCEPIIKSLKEVEENLEKIKG